MLDERPNEVDFGTGAMRAEFRRILDDFEAATRGLWVRSRPMFRTARTGCRPAFDLPEEDMTG
jgi:hypothetical protein